MNPEEEKSLEDKREKYPKYFEGLQTLSDYQKKLDDALDELKKTRREAVLKLLPIFEINYDTWPSELGHSSIKVRKGIFIFFGYY